MLGLLSPNPTLIFKALYIVILIFDYHANISNFLMHENGMFLWVLTFQLISDSFFIDIYYFIYSLLLQLIWVLSMLLILCY